MNLTTILTLGLLLAIALVALALPIPPVDTDFYIRYQGVRFDGHTDAILGVEVSPDGRRLTSWSKDGTFRLWDARTGKCLSVRRGRLDEVSGYR